MRATSFILRGSGRGGFSMAELIVAMFITGLMLASGFVRLSDRPNKATPQQVADLLAEELRTARQTAIRDKTYVALAFPTANGSRPITASYYRLEGDTRPRVTRAAHLGREYPGISIFVGQWNLDTSKLLVPGFGNTPSPPLDGPTWDFSSWGAPFPQDNHIVFSPTGEVYSSGMMLFDNAYHVIVAQGSAYTGTGPGSQLTSASSPCTVTVSRAGLIQTAPGVLAQDGSVTLTSGIMPTALPPAPGPSVSGAPNNNPVIVSVEVAPEPNPDTLPPGVDATVDWQGYITMRIRATDPDGDHLYCQWASVPPSGRGPGGFSSPVASRKEWDGTAWVCTWEWRPPANAVIGDIFTLTPTMLDGRGGSATGNLGVAGKVQVIGQGQIAFERQGDIFIVNADGTGETNLTYHPANDTNPSFSPDGTRIAFSSDRNGSKQIYVMNADGSGVTQLTNFAAPDLGEDCVWAPKSANRLLVRVGDGTVSERMVFCSLDGSLSTTDVAGWEDFTYPTWRRDETLALAAGDTNGQLWESTLDMSSSTEVGGLPTGQRKWHPRFNTGGSKVVFCMGPLVTKKFPPASGMDFDIWVGDYVPAVPGTPGSPGPPIVPPTPPVPSQLTNLKQLTNDPSEDGDPCWSPGSTHIVFSSNRTGNHQLYVMDANGGGVKQLTHRAGVDSIHPSWALR